jgi:hypothetical protein
LLIDFSRIGTPEYFKSNMFITSAPAIPNKPTRDSDAMMAIPHHAHASPK